MEVNCQGCGESQKREKAKKHDCQLCLTNLKSKRVKQESEISLLKTEIKTLSEDSGTAPMIERGIEIVQRTIANRPRDRERERN
jgi:hypothetical protein